jgi:hypothetical protein
MLAASTLVVAAVLAAELRQSAVDLQPAQRGRENHHQTGMFDSLLDARPSSGLVAPSAGRGGHEGRLALQQLNSGWPPGAPGWSGPIPSLPPSPPPNGTNVTSPDGLGVGYDRNVPPHPPKPPPSPPPAPPLPPPGIIGLNVGLRIEITGDVRVDAHNRALVDALRMIQNTWIPMAFAALTLFLFVVHNLVLPSDEELAGKRVQGGCLSPELRHIINVFCTGTCFILCAFAFITFNKLVLLSVPLPCMIAAIQTGCTCLMLLFVNGAVSAIFHSRTKRVLSSAATEATTFCTTFCTCCSPCCARREGDADDDGQTVRNPQRAPPQSAHPHRAHCRLPASRAPLTLACALSCVRASCRRRARARPFATRAHGAASSSSGCAPKSGWASRSARATMWCAGCPRRSSMPAPTSSSSSRCATSPSRPSSSGDRSTPPPRPQQLAHPGKAFRCARACRACVALCAPRRACHPRLSALPTPRFSLCAPPHTPRLRSRLSRVPSQIAPLPTMIVESFLTNAVYRSTCSSTFGLFCIALGVTFYSCADYEFSWLGTLFSLLSTFMMVWEGLLKRHLLTDQKAPLVLSLQAMVRCHTAPPCPLLAPLPPSLHAVHMAHSDGACATRVAFLVHASGLH